MLLLRLPGILIDTIVALERCVRGKGVDDSGGCERLAHGCESQERNRERVVLVHYERDEHEEDEAKSAAGDSAPRHAALANLGHRPADVATLE